jgi:NAD-dependent SIR2 family protein deacetylase
VIPQVTPALRHWGGLLRPGVVWFGEANPDAALGRQADFYLAG